MNYYVYQYFCPIRNEPIYIGKGKNKRITNHTLSTFLKRKHPFYQRLNWILKQNKEPIHFKVQENLSELEAFRLEEELISIIGRKDLKLGPLLNLTNGGDGPSGQICSPKTKLKISKANFGRKQSKESNEKRRKAMLGFKHTQEMKDKISKLHKGRKHSEDFCNMLRNRKHSQDTKLKISLSQLGGSKNAKTWKIINPNGMEEITWNLNQYCKNKNWTKRTAKTYFYTNRSFQGFKAQKI